MASTEQTIPQAPRGPRLRARDALVVVGLAVLLLVLFEGESIRDAGEEMQPGVGRDVVLAVGKPAGWVGDLLPFDEAADGVLGWLSPDDDLAGTGFEEPGATTREGAVPAVTPDSFDPQELGAKPNPPRALDTVLVTGDSLSQPLDVELARELAADAGDDVRTRREPHIGTGVSKSGFVDWGKLSSQQVKELSPEATVVFIGANEGFPMPGGGGEVECCGPEWAAEYAARVRRMMSTYRQGGEGRVYWLTLPLPRDRERQEIARAVNAAIEVAAVPYRSQVRVLDMTEVFTPDGRYRDTMAVDGKERIVREPDGIHLNSEGAGLAAEIVRAALRRDFGR